MDREPCSGVDGTRPSDGTLRRVCAGAGADEEVAVARLMREERDMTEREAREWVRFHGRR